MAYKILGIAVMNLKTLKERINRKKIFSGQERVKKRNR